MAQENGGFVPAKFLEIYSGGGIFNFEELDAADANMVIVLNNALANDRLYNPVNGEVYEKSENFIPFATANTFGLGANRSYTGRERLDAATIDRFRMGRVLLELDENLAESLILG
jgi:cobaltochelatase CobS